jgi:bile acid:Na+ symporter, BASS family
MPYHTDYTQTTGALSNIITHMAGADTGLSVAMTAVSTLLAVFATPLLTKLTIGGAVSVSNALQISMFQIRTLIFNVSFSAR